MRIGFITHYDASDVRSWSGIPFFMAHAMRAAGLNLELLGPLAEAFVRPFRLRSAVQRRLGMKQYLWERDPLVLNALSKEAARKLSQAGATVAFSPGTIPIARLDCEQPIVFWTDMPFAASLDFYTPRAAIASQSLKNGNEMEQAAFDRASLAIFSSEWAKNSAIANYKVDPSKVKVIPFGSNVSWIVDESEVGEIIQARTRGVCKLVFVGVDWTRKGGAFAVAVTNELNRRGIDTELSIVGCRPTAAVGSKVFVYPFISKSSAAGLAAFRDLLAAAHFLILPTRADCTPMVIGEANSLGVPCAITDVGGIPSQVRDGANGRMFSLTAHEEIWADWIEAIFSNQEAYASLALASFREYTARLNWRSSIESFASEVVKLPYPARG